MNPSDEQHETAVDPRTRQIHQLLAAVGRRRRFGEEISDQDIIAQHRDLMPDLAEELGKLQRIQAALAATSQTSGGPSADAAQAKEPFDARNSEFPRGAGFPLAPGSSLRSDGDGGSGGREGIGGSDGSAQLDGASGVILSLSQLDAPIRLPRDGQDITSDHGGPEPLTISSLPAIDGYEVIGEIGRGGQAVVVEGRQRSTGQRVAIKVLRGGPLNTSRERLLFDREVQILASLRQRNVVGIIDRGTTKEGWSYLVMEFIEGQTLNQYARQCRDQAFNPRVVQRGLLGVFLKILAAVQAAHDAGVVHRDLKPSNILVDGEGEPHILDFGVARLTREPADGTSAEASQVTRTGHFVGSLPYSSPEQATGSLVDLDRRSDVYSLGVILYQMLTGKFPYEVTGPMWTVVNNIRNEVPLPPSRVPASTSGAGGVTETLPGRRIKDWFHSNAAQRSLDAIVLKALAKSPQERYPSAAVLADDLRRWLAGLPVASSKRRATFRLLWIALGLLVAAGGVAGAAGWIPWHRNNTPLPLPAPPEPEPQIAGPTPAALPPQETQMGKGASSGPPYVVADLPKFTNSIDMTMVSIPAGEFVMGSPESESGRGNDESQHLVRIAKSFYLAATKVTQGQYRQVMGENPSAPPWLSDDLPVNKVSWEDALVFCAKLSAKEGRPYHLPTEAQWEYACRAGTQGMFAGTGRLPDMGWFKENRSKYLGPVARRLPNQWGLYDMHGLLWEWCADAYGPYPAPGEPADPAASGDRRVVRGGSFDSPWIECRSARRGTHMQTTALGNLGFRVVADEPVQPASRGSSSSWSR